HGPERLPGAERERRLANPGFGRIFTEHMVRILWDSEHGWHDANLMPYAPLSLDPGTSVLHYAQAVFEGLKAFRQAAGGVSAFRAEAHAARFRNAARRLALPELPEETFLDAIDVLLAADHKWVPSAAEHSLYLRPLMYASEVSLSVHPSSEVTFLLIASPSGSYFPRGVKPVTVWLSEDFSRAAPGGTGAGEEGRISVEDWRAGCEEGSLTEVFACGTAAVITPVAAVKSSRGSWAVGNGEPGQVSMRLRKELVDIQRGAAPDRHGWLYPGRVS